MTYIPISKTQILPGGAGSDAFGAIRTSTPTRLFSNYQAYSSSPLFWNTTLTTGGTSTHVPAESSTNLAVTTTNGSEVLRQTKYYFQYQPGSSTKVEMTAVLASPITNLLQELGLGDANNGIFFQTSDLTARWFIRTNTSGSVVETDSQSTATLNASGLVTASNWNLDRLDGSGSADNPSGLQLDITKAQIYFIDLQWLGVGTVRVGFVIDGQLIYAHQFNHANNTTKVYMATANLPIRYRIKANGALASAKTLKSICTSLYAEGGVNPFDLYGIPFSETSCDPANPVTGNSLATNAETAIFAIRPKTVLNQTGVTLFNGAPSAGVINRALIIPSSITLNSLSRNTIFRLYYLPSDSGSTITGGTWTSVSQNSITQYLRGMTAFSLGANAIKVKDFFSTEVADVQQIEQLLSGLRLAVNADGSASDVLLITAQRNEAQTTVVFGGLGWKEIYS